VGKLAIVLYRLLREHRLSIPADDALRDELLTVKLRESSPGITRLDHDSGRHDDRAIALAMVAEALETPDPSPSFVFDDAVGGPELENVDLHREYAMRRHELDVDFGEGRDPLAGQGAPSPYV
jgi:hypothetical protein